MLENIFNTMMNVKGKTEDNMKARIDIPLFCHNKNIELNIPLFCHHNNLHTQHMEELETNIVQTIYKLEIIFPSSFFDSIEYLPIYLPFKAKV
jgi:hypothetical protein